MQSEHPDGKYSYKNGYTKVCIGSKESERIKIDKGVK
jgi:hypothetical protein